MTGHRAVIAGGGWGRARGRRHARPAPVVAVALIAAFAVAWLAPAAGVLPAARAEAAATDLTLVTDATYLVQPDKARVRVTVTIVAANHKPETRTTKYWFDHAFLAVQPEATDIHISGVTGATVQVARRTAAATLLKIGFGTRIYSGKSRTYKLAFSLTGKPGRSTGTVRVGPSLTTFAVWAFASDGATGSQAEVRFPAGYDVSVESGTFTDRTTGADGGTVLATRPLANPLTFFAYVSGQRSAVFTDASLAVPAGGSSIALTIRAWQDDPAWGSRVRSMFVKALPLLRDEIGIDWPATDPTVVQEAVSRAAGGYAGLFDPTGRRIEVAYWAGPLVMLHEAAHGWFNGGLVGDRWAAEGFASLYAERAAAALKVKAAPLALTPALLKASVPLNAWANVSASDPAADRTTEAFGYAASVELARAIAARAGDDAMRRVWADAAGRIGAYQPPAAAGTTTTPETVTSPPDWRGLLDLLEAETGRDFTDLWRQSVVRPDEAPLLDARAQARASYQRTLELADGWALPRGIRDALRAWQFDAAEHLMADARTVLAQRGAVEAQAAADGLTLPAAMRGAFEAGDMTGASAQAETERNAMLAYEQAAASRGDDTDPLTRIGMLGEHPEADLAAAAASLAAGDLDATLSSADDAYRAWNGAWQEGRRRALLAIAVVASILVLVSALAGRARRARRARPAIG